MPWQQRHIALEEESLEHTSDSSYNDTVAVAPTTTFKDRIRRSVQRYRRKSPASFAAVLVILLLIFIVVLLVVQTLAITSALSDVRPPPSNNGVSKLVADVRQQTKKVKRGVDGNSELMSVLDKDFTRAIRPIPCHSHNDYDRSVPLFEAIAAGCTGIEADVWVDRQNNSNLVVSHSKAGLKSAQSLSDLYLSPLQSILDYWNEVSVTSPSNTSFGDLMNGIYASASTQSVVLLIDFKESSKDIWPLLQTLLEPLRQKGYLQYWNETSNSLVLRPLIVVASGEADFGDVQSTGKNQHRDIFYDAPLLELDKGIYNTSNSFYASTNWDSALGSWKMIPMLQPSKRQLNKLKSQVAKAKDLGLTSRYWGAPNWPVSDSVRIWKILVRDVGVGILNVDRVWTASHWNWNWCILGFGRYC